MTMRVKGEITAFLSLIFVLLVSFILSITESAAIQTAKNMSRINVDRSVFSLFGEYQKELLEEYEIFAFDSGYGSGSFEESKIVDRLSYYGSMGLEQEITDIQFLTDNNGQAFREAVIAFMEAGTGIDAVRDVTGLTSQWEEQSIAGSQISNEITQSVSQYGSLIPEAASLIQGTRGSAFLSLVLPRDFQLSGKSISLSEQVSGREKNTGWGSFPAQQNLDGVEEKLLFQQYVLDKFGNAVDTKGDNRSLNYEVEYLLCGNERDSDNLKEVLTRLLIFRLAMNYLYLQTDTDRQNEAAAMAVTLSAVLLHPELESAIRQLLIVLWAFGESVVDLRALLSGEKVSFYKTDESWQLTLSSLFTLGTAEDAIEGADAQSGLSYADYLQILLYLESEDELTMRALDRVEQNLITEKNLSFFKADLCVTKIKLSNKASIGAGFTYTFPVYYGYL
ncbi:MAG: hypothetical protein J5983_04760 [Ruminococcus sp.]|nr:hypothetical protein [Ruminococcus sp.]